MQKSKSRIFRRLISIVVLKPTNTESFVQTWVWQAMQRVLSCKNFYFKEIVQKIIFVGSLKFFFMYLLSLINFAQMVDDGGSQTHNSSISSLLKFAELLLPTLFKFVHGRTRKLYGISNAVFLDAAPTQFNIQLIFHAHSIFSLIPFI